MSMIQQLAEHHKINLFIVMVILILDISAQDLTILTPLCDRTVGKSVQMQITYPSGPGDPLAWNNPQSRQVGSCLPANFCTKPTGYSLEYSGNTYSITIDNATTDDSGIWEVTDSTYSSRTVTLDLIAYLPGLVVTCDTNRTVTLTTGLSQTVTCSTECLDPSVTNPTLEFVFDGYIVSSTVATTSACTSPLFSSSKTITLNADSGRTGNTSLCYNLTSGECSYTQPSTECITVVFPTETATSLVQTTDLSVPHTDVVISSSVDSTSVVNPTYTSVNGTHSNIDVSSTISLVSSAELPTTTLKPYQPESDLSIGLIVVLALACTILVIGLGILIFFVWFEIKKDNNNDSLKNKSWVTALLVLGVIFCIIAIGLTGYALASKLCGACLYAGIALLVIDAILISVAIAVYYTCIGKHKRRLPGSTKEEENGTHQTNTEMIDANNQPAKVEDLKKSPGSKSGRRQTKQGHSDKA